MFVNRVNPHARLLLRCEPSRPLVGARHAGVSMIEVLIAMVLVAIGTLAIIALQLSSKRSNLDAAQRARAAQVGYSFMERIRGNNSSAGLAAYEAAAAAGYGGGKQVYSGPDCGAGSACTAAQLASYDSRQFERELDGTAEQVAGNNVGGLIAPLACLSASTGGGSSANFALTLVWRGTGAIPNDASVVCGAGTGNYGSNDVYRRTLTIGGFVLAR